MIWEIIEAATREWYDGEDSSTLLTSEAERRMIKVQPVREIA